MKEKDVETSGDDLIALPGRAGLIYVARVGGQPNGKESISWKVLDTDNV
jgi:hypothetical protein